MNRDLNAIAAALGADIEYLADSLPGHECEILRFGDDRLRYELHLQLEYDTAILAMDPIKPIQPCPMFEYSFCCTDITVGRVRIVLLGTRSPSDFLTVKFLNLGIG